MDCSRSIQQIRELLKSYSSGIHEDYAAASLSHLGISIFSDYAEGLLSDKEDTQRGSIDMIAAQMMVSTKAERRAMLHMLELYLHGDWASPANRQQADELLAIMAPSGVQRRNYPGVSDKDQRPKADTQTQGFKTWFGNSVLVRDGRPITVWHGTLSEFDSFQHGDIGFHFGSKVQAFRRINDMLEDRTALGQDTSTGPQGKLMPFYLRIEHPIHLNGDPLSWTSGRLTELLRELKNPIYHQMADEIDTTIQARIKANPNISDAAFEQERRVRAQLVKEIMKAHGFDGVIYKNNYEWTGSSYLVFDSSQVKSAYNSGGFNPSKENIYE